jgi:hypothetical protein
MENWKLFTSSLNTVSVQKLLVKKGEGAPFFQLIRGYSFNDDVTVILLGVSVYFLGQ